MLNFLTFAKFKFYTIPAIFIGMLSLNIQTELLSGSGLNKLKKSMDLYRYFKIVISTIGSAKLTRHNVLHIRLD